MDRNGIGLQVFIVLNMVFLQCSNAQKLVLILMLFYSVSVLQSIIATALMVISFASAIVGFVGVIKKSGHAVIYVFESLFLTSQYAVCLILDALTGFVCSIGMFASGFIFWGLFPAAFAVFTVGARFAHFARAEVYSWPYLS